MGFWANLSPAKPPVPGKTAVGLPEMTALAFCVLSVHLPWASAAPLSHRGENTVLLISASTPKNKGEAGQEYDLYGLYTLGSIPEQIFRDACLNCHCSCFSRSL